MGDEVWDPNPQTPIKELGVQSVESEGGGQESENLLAGCLSKDSLTVQSFMLSQLAVAALVTESSLSLLLVG